MVPLDRGHSSCSNNFFIWLFTFIILENSYWRSTVFLAVSIDFALRVLHSYFYKCPPGANRVRAPEAHFVLYSWSSLRAVLLHLWWSFFPQYSFEKHLRLGVVRVDGRRQQLCGGEGGGGGWYGFSGGWGRRPSPPQIPILAGWVRQTCKVVTSEKKPVFVTEIWTLLFAFSH